MSEGKLYVLLVVAGLVPLLLVLFLGRSAHAEGQPADQRADAATRVCASPWAQASGIAAYAHGSNCRTSCLPVRLPGRHLAA